MATYTKDKRCEIPDNTPVEIPLGYKAPETLQEMIARMIRVENMQQMAAKGMETFEEADDFDVDDDADLVSEYQMLEMQEERPYVEERRKERVPKNVPGGRRATDPAAPAKDKQEGKPVGEAPPVVEEPKGTV